MEMIVGIIVRIVTAIFSSLTPAYVFFYAIYYRTKSWTKENKAIYKKEYISGTILAAFLGVIFLALTPWIICNASDEIIEKVFLLGKRMLKPLEIQSQQT